MTTIAAHAEETARRAGDEYTIHDKADTWDGWTIEAVQESLLAYEWPGFGQSGSTIVSADGTAAYVLVQGMMEIKAIYEVGIESYPLIATTKAALKDMGVDPTSSGTPTHWYVSRYLETSDGIEIKLWPVPTAIVTYQVLGYRDASDLVSTDLIPFTGAMEPSIRHAVMAAYRDQIDDEPGYLRSRQAYVRTLRKAFSRYRHEAAQRHNFEWHDIQAIGNRLPDTIVP